MNPLGYRLGPPVPPDRPPRPEVELAAVSTEAPPPVPTEDPRRTALGWGAALFAFALLIRWAGIDWGLPNADRHWSLHPDEPVVFAYSQRVEPAKLDFTPGFYNYGTLYLTLNRVAADMVSAYGGGPKQADGSDAWEWVGRVHAAGRAMSAFAGAGLVWVVFALLRRWTNLTGAAFGATALALAPGLVVHSRFQTVDVLATFLLALSLFFALELVPRESDPPPIAPDRAALLAGLFAGLSAGTKYTGVLALVALGAVCLGTRRWRPLALGAGVAAAAFLVTTPGAVLDGGKFWADFGYEMAHTSTGHGLVFAGTAPGFLFHLGNLVLGFGTLLTLLGVVGLVQAVREKAVWAVALVLFALVYFLVIGRAEVKFLRYVFPLLPVLAVGFGWWVGKGQARGDLRGKGVVVLGILAVGGLLGGGAGLTAVATQAMSLGDPRDEAGRWLKENAKGQTVGLVSDPWFMSPTLFPEVGAPRWVPFETRDSAMRAATDPRVVRFVPPNPDERFDWDTRLLDEGPDFVAYSSFDTEGLDRLAGSTNVPAEFRLQIDRFRAFSQRLQAEYDLAQVFPPEALLGPGPLSQVHDLMYVRPTLWVWKRKPPSATP